MKDHKILFIIVKRSNSFKYVSPGQWINEIVDLQNEILLSNKME